MTKSLQTAAIVAFVIVLGTISSASRVLAQSKSKPQSAAAKTVSAKNDSQLTWKRFAPKGSDAEFLMPTEPRETERSFRSLPGEPLTKVKVLMSTVNDGQAALVMSYHDLQNTPSGKRAIAKVLDGAVRGTVALVIGSVEKNEEVKLRSYPGRKFTYKFIKEGQVLKADAEVYLIGRRQFFLNAIHTEAAYDPKLSEKFLDSFNPFDPEEDLGAQATGATALDGFTIPEDELPKAIR